MSALRISSDNLSIKYKGKLTWRIDPWIGSYWSGSVQSARIGAVSREVGIFNARDDCPGPVRLRIDHGDNLCWTTWFIDCGVFTPAMPGIENARGWFGAWVDDLYNDPEVHTPWGDFDTITFDFEIELHNVDLRVERTTPYLSQIVGHRGYRKPEDAHLTYSWVINENTYHRTYISCECMMDENGEDISELLFEGYFGEEAWGNAISPTGGSIQIEMHDGVEGYDYVVTELESEEYEFFYDGFDQIFGTVGSGRIRGLGGGKTTSWTTLETFDKTTNPPILCYCTIGPSFAYNLSNLSVYQVDRGKITELNEDAVVDLFGHTSDVKTWRSFSAENPLVVQYTSWEGWKDNSGLDGTCSGPVIQPRINEDWAAEHNHYEKDRNIHIDAGGLDWPCQGSPYRELITLEHTTETEIFNPLDADECPAVATSVSGITGEWARSHSGFFEGYGPGWLFTIPQNFSGGKVTINLRSNMEERIEQAKLGPDFYIPEGYGENWYPPAIPDCHRIRKAGGWLPDEEPPESACDWDNWAWIKLVLASDSEEWDPTTISMRVGYLSPIIYDNFLSGDARRIGGIQNPEPYDVDFGDISWLEYNVPETPGFSQDVNGNRFICLLFPNNVSYGLSQTVSPDLRWVRQVEFEFPAEMAGLTVFIGAYLSGPPEEDEWTTDTEPGGHALSVHHTIPEEDDDDSFGPDIGTAIITDGKPGGRVVLPYKVRIEEGIPYYLEVIGATSGYDLGTPTSWESWAAMANQQEGFVCELNYDIFYPMTYELGDPNGQALWVPTAADIREGGDNTGRILYGVEKNEVGIQFAQRVRTVYPPALRVFDLWAVKHLAGGVWGVACREDRNEPALSAAEVMEKTYEKIDEEESEWETLGESYMSEHAPLLLWPMVTGQQNITGLGTSSNNVTSAGTIPPREFIWALLLGTEIGEEDRIGLAISYNLHILLSFYTNLDTIYHIYSNPEDGYWRGIDNAFYVNPKEDFEGNFPAPYFDSRYNICYLCYIKDGAVYRVESTNVGKEWGNEMAIQLGYDVKGVSTWYDSQLSISHIVALTEDEQVVHACSYDNFDTFINGVNIVTTDVDACPVGFTKLGPGGQGTTYVVVLRENELYLYKSNDLGKTWEEVS